jgi:hypothetical protein
VFEQESWYGGELASAVGVALMNWSKIGNSNSSFAQTRKLLRSVLEIPPIGLMSAEEPVMIQCLYHLQVVLGLRTVVFREVPSQASPRKGHNQ